MANEFEINVPESYGDQHDKNELIPPSKPIEKIPNSINKVRKVIIRGVLKGDEFLSNQQ